MTDKRDYQATTSAWINYHEPVLQAPIGEDEFYVVGEHKGQTAYYCGWWQTYGEALLCHHPKLGAKAMKRANANRVSRRLEDPTIWGGKWRLVKADPTEV